MRSKKGFRGEGGGRERNTAGGSPSEKAPQIFFPVKRKAAASGMAAKVEGRGLLMEAENFPPLASGEDGKGKKMERKKGLLSLLVSEK